MNSLINEMETLDIIADKKETIGISTIYTLNSNRSKLVYLDKKSNIEKFEINCFDTIYTDKYLTIILNQEKTIIIDNSLNKIVVELCGLTDYLSDKFVKQIEVGNYCLYHIGCKLMPLDTDNEPPSEIVIVFNSVDKTIERIIDNVEKISYDVDFNKAKIFYYIDNFEKGVIEYFYKDSSKNESYTYSDDMVIFSEILYNG